jgi:hypothetical protein
VQLSSLQYSSRQGWSGPFPEWDSEQTLVVAFGASELVDHAGPLEELKKAFPNSVRIGCSTSGEIFGTTINDGSISVAICRFDDVQLRHSASKVGSSDGSRAAGRAVAEPLMAPGLRAIFVLSDGLHVNGSDLLAGINEVVGPDVTVTGGLAGDAQRFKRTWVLLDDGPVAGVVSAVGFYGAARRIGHGARGGWAAPSARSPNTNNVV